MNRKQKALVLLLAGCMCIAAGCGQTAKTEEKPPEALPEEESGEEEVRSAPQLLIQRENFDKYEQDTDRWLLHMEYDVPEMSGDGYEAVSEGVRKWSGERVQELQELAEQYAGYAEEEAASPDAYGDYYQYSIFEDVKPARADKYVISMLELNSEYTGGAHGSYGYTGITFDSGSGQILELEDILTDSGEFRAAAIEYITEKLQEQYGDGLISGYEEAVKDIWTRNEGPNWYLDAAGITFIFNPYEIGPYAMGAVYVTAPYTEFASYIKAGYAGMSDSGTAKIPENETVALPENTAQGDQPAQLRVYQKTEEEYGDGPVYVELGDSAAEAGNFARMGDAYLLKKEDGRSFVILDADYASDDFVTFVYELTDGTLQERDRLEGVSLQDGTVNTETLTLRMHLDVLGTYSSLMNYTIGEDGRLVQGEEFFRIQPDDTGQKMLTTVRELPVVIEDKEAVLPKGTRLYITGTDNEGTAVFHNEDTQTDGEIRYTRGDKGEDTWTIYIDGIPDYEYFETIPYAG